MSPEIRAYRPADLDAVYDICVRTGKAGEDARGTLSSDRLLGDIWAVPYVVLEPEHAHIADDGDGNGVGYIVGTVDSERFAKRYRAEWLPAVEGRYTSGDPRDEYLLSLHHNPERMVIPALADYPAHLHINLLPEWQGAGLGRALMAAFLSGLREAGVTGVHLGVERSNTSAQAFYQRLGFRRFPVPGTDALYLVRDTRP